MTKGERKYFASRIITTPESIVRQHRNEGLRTGPAYSAPWYKQVAWDVVITWTCGVALSVCFWYLAIRAFIPFVRMLVWG